MRSWVSMAAHGRSAAPRSVLIIGSEAVPFAKTGGLADVLGALPPALARLGWDVTVALPRYRGVTRRRRSSTTLPSPSAASRATSASTKRRSPTARAPCSSTARSSSIARRCTAPAAPTIRTTRAASRCSCARRSSSRRAAARAPSVVHAHDWQAGLAPVYLKTLYASHPGARRHAERLHDPQPRVSGDLRRRTGCRGSTWRGISSRIDRLEFWGRISFLKGGINDADVITTVSPRYAEEIQTPEFGFGFDGILRAPRARSRRHPERHRHGRVESGARSLPAGSRSTPTTCRASAAAKRALLGAVRPAARRGRAASGRSSG